MSYILNNENIDVGVTSTLNYTTTPLASGETYTGTAELNDYNDVMIQIATDQDGVYYLEFSPDGTNWDSSLSYVYSTSRINPPHILVKGPRYFRVRFVNGDTAQSYIRLNTYFGSFQKLSTNLRGTLSENFDAIVTRPSDYRSEVAMNKRQGTMLWNKFGYNQDIDVGTEIIASWGGTFTPLLAASTLSIVSTDAADDDGGTGVNSIVIYGINEERESVIEVITMNGTTPVVTTSTWLGINRVAMFLVGSGQVNAGDINVTATSDSSTQAQMPAGGGVTQQCIFHVPVNHQFNAEWLRINVLNRAKDAELTVKLWVYSAVNNGKQEVYSIDIDTSKTNDISENPQLPFPVGEKSVMWLECTSDKADVIVNGRFSGILERIV